ncbi:MAG: cbb3-type cytochrome oxidase assembly protein CcoS [Flavobacteriales bacterium]|nr:cbb3-type cytochrome oxidase assembly protein CcoS [Flavobacteriales bacterium]
MKVLILLISASLFMALLFLALFFKALKAGQFDDLESPSFRILNEKQKTGYNAKGKV